MTTIQRKLVHKQFNSPIGLYSDNNVKATLDRELKVLSNGTMGIDFDDCSKPTNLANSAVLRMLEEEENQKRHAQHGGLKRVAWPPEEYTSPSRVVPQPQRQSPALATVAAAVSSQATAPQNQYQPQPTQAFQPVVSNDQQYQPQPQSQYQQQQYQQQQQYESQQREQFEYQQYQQQQQQQQQQPQQQPYYRQPSPGIITLRKEAPFMQQSAPVFTSQPAAASFGGGTNMRGDQKWPPQEYKQSEVDNEERRKIALGPVFRPRRVQKDYTQFFSQHALNATYPSYRAPPGTQHSAAN